MSTDGCRFTSASGTGGFEMLAVTSNPNDLGKSGSLPWNMSTTSFSVEITSTDQSLFTFHHRAPVRNKTGTGKVSSDAVYWVASITKTFNVFALLLNTEEHLDAPVTLSTPELQGFEQYGEVTPRMLASQVPGVPRDCRYNYSFVKLSKLTNSDNPFDLYGLNGDELQNAGFPQPEPGDLPSCAFSVADHAPDRYAGHNRAMALIKTFRVLRNYLIRTSLELLFSLDKECSSWVMTLEITVRT